MTDGNDTNPATYESCEDNGYEDNDVDDDDDIVPTEGSKTEEPILALHMSNWRVCRCNLIKNLTVQTTEEEKAAWDQDYMPLSKQILQF